MLLFLEFKCLSYVMGPVNIAGSFKKKAPGSLRSTVGQTRRVLQTLSQFVNSKSEI